MKLLIKSSVFCLGVLITLQTHALGEFAKEVTEGVSDTAKTVGDAVSDTASDVKDGFDQTLGMNLTAKEIDHKTSNALASLYKNTPVAEKLSHSAEAVLVFPEIVKGGIGIGGQYGEGAMRVKGKTTEYYNTVSGSYGLQLGAQKYGYAMFFMTKDAINYLKDNSDGWEVGVGPSVVVVDKGLAKTLTTTTAKDSIYVFIFNQKGLMGGLGVQGTKITQIHPK